MKIAAIADLHIKLLQNHKETQEIINEELIPSLRKSGIQLLFIVGDIVHSKTQLSPEQITIVSNLFERLIEFTDVFVILGNHDYSKSNESRMDALTPIINPILSGNNNNKLLMFEPGSSIKNIKYGKENIIIGTYGIKDIDNWPTIEKARELFDLEYKNTTIALYHGIIKDSMTDLNFRFDDGIPIHFFDGWDFSIFGDIHLRQMFRKDQTAIMLGSCWCQNFGEDIEKGYSILDTNEKKFAFVPIKNKYGYYTIRIDGIEVPKINSIYGNPKIRILTNMKNLTVADRENIRMQAYQLYNPSSVTVELISDFENEKNINNVDTINFNSTDLASINNLIKVYLQNRNIDENLINNVIDVNKDLYSLLPVQEIQTNIQWNLKKLTFYGFFSYKDKVEINFEKLKGIIGLFGENASGKSSIPTILLYTIFNNTPLKVRSKDIVNRKLKKAYSKVEFSIGTENFEIEREIILGNEMVSGSDENDNSQTSANFYKIQSDGRKISLNGSNRWDTERNIRSYLGDLNNIIITSISPQDELKRYIESEKKDRKDMLATFLNLKIFEQLFNLSNKEIEEIKGLLRLTVKQDYPKLISKLERNKVEIEESIEKVVKSNKLIKRTLENYGNRIELLYGKRTQDVEYINIEFLHNNIYEIDNNILDYNKKIEDINRKILSNVEIYKILTEKYSTNIHSLLLDKLNQKKAINEKHQKLQTEIIIIEDTIDRIKNTIQIKPPGGCKFEECPFRNMIEVSESTLSLKIKEYDNLKTNMDLLYQQLEKFENIENEIKEVEDTKIKIDDLSEQIKLSNSNRKLYNEKINSLQITLDNLKIKEKKYIENEELIKYTHKIDEEIEQLKNEKVEFEKEVTKNEKDIIEFHGKLEVIKNNISNMKNLMEEVERNGKLLKVYELYQICTHRDGIVNDIIENVLPKVNSEINRLLSHIVDFEVRFECTKDSKKILIWMLDKENGKRSLEACSGMEKMISSIAIRTALSNLSALPKPNVFIIDEGFGSLDNNYINSIGPMFLLLLNYFQNVIIITHVQSLKDIAQNIIEVVKYNDGCSHIQKF